MLALAVAACVHPSPAAPAAPVGPLALTVGGAAPDVVQAVVRLSGPPLVVDPAWAGTRVDLDGDADLPATAYAEALVAALSHLAATGAAEGTLGPPRLPTPEVTVRIELVTVAHGERIVGEPLGTASFVAAAGPDWFATACACGFAPPPPQMRPGGEVDDVSADAAVVLDGEGLLAVRIGDALSDGRTVAGISPGKVRLSDGEVLTESVPFDASTIARDAEDRYVVENDVVAPFRASAAGLGRALLHRGADGAFDGYRLSAIRADSLLDRLGVKNGDVVQRLRFPGADGERVAPLSSMDEAKAAWELLWTEPAFCLDLARRGEPMTLCYQVTGR